MLKELLRRAGQIAGYEIRKLPSPTPERDWIADLQHLLRWVHAPVIFDVGANVGSVTTRLAAAFPAPACIHAFEPAAKTAVQLALNLAVHSHVRVHQLAVGDRPGRLSLYHGINSQLNRLAPAGALGNGTAEEVDVVTVDQVMGQLSLEHIDVLKTDTEGFDDAVLRGAAKALQRGGLRAIISEATFDVESNWHTRFDDIRQHLAPRGFCLHGVYDCEHWGVHLKYCNVLFLREADFPALTARAP